MKYTKFSKYVGDLADEMSLEDLLSALSDYMLESGFESQYSYFQQMDEHSLLYACPEVRHRLDFLWAGDTTPFRAPDSDFLHADLREDMQALIHRYLDSGLDVIIVDQTTPEHRSESLHCVKAIVPGTLPMTFGHDYRRLDGLPRLSRLLTGAINDQPHPFP